MTLQEFYDRIGGDYKATISRLPSEALIKKFVLKYPGDPSFSQLKDALAAQDWELAFRASHTLKGVAQNLGMDRLYKRPPPRSATPSAARSRWRMPASGRRWWPRMRKCWPRSGSCKNIRDDARGGRHRSCPGHACKIYVRRRGPCIPARLPR